MYWQLAECDEIEQSETKTEGWMCGVENRWRAIIQDNKLALKKKIGRQTYLSWQGASSHLAQKMCRVGLWG